MKKFMVMAVLGLAIGIAATAQAKTLVDVPSGHWAADAIQRLVDMGLVEGYKDGTFQGDKGLTRYEYAMVVDRLVKLLDGRYCTKEDCSGPGEKLPGNLATKEDLAEVKDIVQKLAAEFKDELAALKVQVDKNTTDIAKLQKDVATARIGNVAVKGSVRQRIDAPNTELAAGAFYTSYYGIVYDPLGAAGVNDLQAGYEMLPSLTFSGPAGDDVDFSIGLSSKLDSSPMSYAASAANVEQGQLVIDHAWADVDFTKDVRELDLFKLKSGYQGWSFGPYGMLADNGGMVSNPGIRVDLAKSIVNFTGIVAMTNMAGGVSGLSSTSKDAYSALRLGLDTRWLDLGVNYLADGMEQEKGWGVDVVAPLLTHTPFLKEVRAEYMQVTDLANGTTPGVNVDDNSFIVGLDVYKSTRFGVTVSYADLPARVALSSMDGSPFTEYDSACPPGLDVYPNGVDAKCYAYESGKMLFPAGFEGLGVEASYIVFGDITLGGKVALGNFAGDLGITADGDDYPGFGALSVSKPINAKSSFRMEYMMQGKDPILMDRVRGELLISF